MSDLDKHAPRRAAKLPRSASRAAADRPSSQIAAFAARRAEVARSDHEEFQAYLQAKQAHARAAREEAATRTRTKTADAADAARHAHCRHRNSDSGRSGVAGVRRDDRAVRRAAARRRRCRCGGGAASPDQPRDRSIARSDVGGRSLGKWIALLPTKLGGGTYALDLNSNRVLASIWYWNYGDFNPISHHLCAFPSADPYNGFEFVNSTQGGKNCLIYGIPTNITDPAPASTSIASATTVRRCS